MPTPQYGPQNLGKTQLGYAICSEQWFGSDGLTMDFNHDDVSRVSRWWCLELGVLDGYRGHSISKMKNFLTKSLITPDLLTEVNQKRFHVAMYFGN